MEDYLRKQEVLKLWGQIVDLFATKSSVTTLQGYFTDGKAKKAIADGDGNTISSTYLKKSGGTMANTNVVTNLNADLLDGQHATYFGYNKEQGSYDCNEVGTHFAAYRFDNAPLNAFPNAAWSNMLVLGNGLDTMTQIGGPYSAQELYFRNGNWKNDGTGTIRTESWHRIWHDGNDGSGSGLDADLLDGQHGSYYAVKSTTEGAIDVLASGLGQLSAMTNDNKQAIDAQGDSITELYGYFDGGVAKSAARLTTTSKTAWGKTFWTANGVPDSISGDMTNVGDVKMNNDKGIYIKDYGGTHREVLKLDYTDLLSIGYETGLAGYDTSIWGSNVILSAYDGSEYKDIATAKVESGVSKFDVDGNITAQGNITSQGNMTSQGNVIGMHGVAAYGIADLSLITN